MTFDWSVVWQHRDTLAAATGTTFMLTIATMAIAVPCGVVVAALRLHTVAPVRAAATAYVELFRNLPLLLVVYWAFYVVPILTGVGLSPLATGLAALALNVTAYNAETFRAGAGEHVGVAVQGYVAGFGDRGQRAGVRVDADPRAVLSRARDADGDGRHLLAAGLSAG